MAFLGGIFTSIWAKIALIGVVIGALGFFLYRIYKAGGDAERLRQATDDLKYVIGTAKETEHADQNLADPMGTRARRVRERFTRRENN